MFSSNTSQVASTGSALAEAIDFDGTNDYLFRSSDLTGNADGKTFTFSAWIWYPTETAAQYVFTSGQGFEVTVRSTTGGSYIQILGRNAAGTTILQMDARTTSSPAVNAATFYHLLVSVDLTNTAARGIYINDQPVTPTWTTYTNDNIDFTLSANNISVAASRTGTNKYKGRLSNVFLDYTYRGLFVAARRLFVTADLKPAAGQAALNPIMYLPMSDPTNPGLNQGTGGNFTLTGVVARSGRGLNKYNAPYSVLDGAADYLTRTPTVIAESSSFTFQFCFFGLSSYGANEPIFLFPCTGGDVRAWLDQFGFLRLQASKFDSVSGFNIAILAAVSTAAYRLNSNNVITCSIDLSSTASRHVYLNGQSLGMTWTTYVVGQTFTINTGGGGNMRMFADSTPGQYFQGSVGAFWYDNSYSNLSVATTREKFVTGTGIDAKPVDLGANGELPTGTSPKIYLPLYGNNAGKNYGTIGDFTVVSGPYTGARGPNEFWGNRVRFSSSSTYLSRSTLLPNSKTFSFSCFFSKDVDSQVQPTFQIMSGSTLLFHVQLTGSGIVLYDTVNNGLYSTSTTTFVSNRIDHLCVCIDMADTNKRFVYHNGTLLSTTWTLYPNQVISLSGAINVGRYGTANYFAGTISEFYLTTTYIDFSQEANRLKFRDAFGNPVELSSQITAAGIPNPQAYLRFPPTTFGTNSGTGGVFTVNGTLTDGGQL